MRIIPTAFAVVVLAAACGSDDDDAAGTIPAVTQNDEPGTTSASPSSPPSTQPTIVIPTSGPTGTGSPATPVSEQAIADLATQRDVDPAEIVLVSEEFVTWPDSSLGCPQPGMGYLQVLTDGVRIVLELDGEQVEYHAAADGRPPFLCTNPQPGVGE